MGASETKIKDNVKKHYASAISGGGGCCGGSPAAACCAPETDSNLVQIHELPRNRIVSAAGYSREELGSLPAEAVVNSFGCGNPLAFAGVEPGQVVVDIGSGAGIDCLLAAQKVGPEGRVIGIDMTPPMIEKAHENARKAAAGNVEFRLGEAEAMPLENESADWIISNCVINLSPNKPKVFREAYRVLRPGGRLSVSDIMVEDIPWIIRRSAALYSSCVSGAIPEEEYLKGLCEAGFSDVRVTERIVYDRDQLAGLLRASGLFRSLGLFARGPFLSLLDRYVVGKIWSAKVIAQKPGASQ